MRSFGYGIFVVLLITSASVSFADTTPIDLSSWSAHNLDLGGPSTASWVLSNGNTTVIQNNNADPSFYTNNLDLVDYTMQGTWLVATTSDDDWMGFVFGYQDPAHCYVMSWKKNYQNGSLEGFCIKKIHAPSVGDLVSLDFATRPTDTENSTILASEFNTTSGWLYNTLYTFSLTFSSGSFHVVVQQESTVLWDVTVNDNTYTSGQFGFYNHSQPRVKYSGFTLNTPPECNAGGLYFGDANIPIQFDASGSTDVDGSIVDYSWDFGDGTTGTGVTPTHTYAEDGFYDVVLCVTDNEGLTRCCSPQDPVVPVDNTTWGSLKSLYR